MRRISIIAVATAAFMVAGGSAVVAEECYEDAVGDAGGAAPDIVAITVSEPENESTVRIAIEFAEEPPLGSDMETWTDVLFLGMAAEPETDERGALAGDVYLTGTHGVRVESQADTGALLVTPDAMYSYVVDIAVAGPVITFTLDRKLIGSPLDLYWQVLVGVERDEPVDDEDDMYPDAGEPPAVYRIGRTSS